MNNKKSQAPKKIFSGILEFRLLLCGVCPPPGGGGEPSSLGWGEMDMGGGG